MHRWLGSGRVAGWVCCRTGAGFDGLSSLLRRVLHDVSGNCFCPTGMKKVDIDLKHAPSSGLHPESLGRVEFAWLILPSLKKETIHVPDTFHDMFVN